MSPAHPLETQSIAASRGTYDFVLPPLALDTANDLAWDFEADVAVVGLGAAGASAAIEAADRGARVAVLDRLNGGGASGISGGVVYAGGGTRQQREAGIEDTPDNMFRYLKEQVGAIVQDSTLRRFCDQSVESLEWLERQGVKFSSRFLKKKNSFPGGAWGLYYSGNESYAPFCDLATPAARGHIVQASGYATGHGLMKALIETLQGRLRERVTIFTNTEVFQLVTDRGGKLLGLRCRSASGPGLLMRRLLNSLANKFMMGLPQIGAPIRRLGSYFGSDKRVLNVRAPKGVILSTGGFVFNRTMLEEATEGKVYSPMPLGEDCHGSGIRLGQSLGGATNCMGRLTYWRFYAPPEHFLRAVVVGQDGERLCNEALYGASVADIMIERSAGRGWLILDQATLDGIRADLKGDIHLVQRLTGWVYLFRGLSRASTLGELAQKLGIPATALERTMNEYNRRIVDVEVDEFRKSDAYRTRLSGGPWYAVDISIGAAGNQCFSLTLGGLRVDEASGQVLGQDGRIIDGLYAAGRCAVGVCSHTYVSGLSLADCIFSGRRAGGHAAAHP